MPIRSRNKYGARKVVVDGITFDSAKEARRYGQLKLLERAGEIKDLRMQTRFTFLDDTEEGPIRYVGSNRAITYVDDFDYIDSNTGVFVVEDTKGVQTPIFKIKRALMKHFHGIDIKIT